MSERTQERSFERSRARVTNIAATITTPSLGSIDLPPIRRLARKVPPIRRLARKVAGTFARKVAGTFADKVPATFRRLLPRPAFRHTDEARALLVIRLHKRNRAAAAEAGFGPDLLGNLAVPRLR